MVEGAHCFSRGQLPWGGAWGGVGPGEGGAWRGASNPVSKDLVLSSGPWGHLNICGTCLLSHEHMCTHTHTKSFFKGTSKRSPSVGLRLQSSSTPTPVLAIPTTSSLSGLQPFSFHTSPLVPFEAVPPFSSLPTVDEMNVLDSVY